VVSVSAGLKRHENQSVWSELGDAGHILWGVREVTLKISLKIRVKVSLCISEETGSVMGQEMAPFEGISPRMAPDTEKVRDGNTYTQ